MKDQKCTQCGHKLSEKELFRGMETSFICRDCDYEGYIQEIEED